MEEFFDDFLYLYDLITEHLHAKVINSVNELKQYCIAEFADTLWEYQFLYRWSPTDSVSEADFTAESELFAKSLGEKLDIPRIALPVSRVEAPVKRSPAQGF